MYYNYLNRDQPYLRSYRTHNLWFDQYQKKVRCPRVTSFHIGFFKRMGKTYSGVSQYTISNLLFLSYSAESWLPSGVSPSSLEPNSCFNSRELKKATQRNKKCTSDLTPSS